MSTAGPQLPMLSKAVQGPLAFIADRVLLKALCCPYATERAAEYRPK
jgi:hypothetical protein